MNDLKLSEYKNLDFLLNKLVEFGTDISPLDDKSLELLPNKTNEEVLMLFRQFCIDDVVQYIKLETGKWYGEQRFIVKANNKTTLFLNNGGYEEIVKQYNSDLGEVSDNKKKDLTDRKRDSIKYFTEIYLKTPLTLIFLVLSIILNLFLLTYQVSNNKEIKEYKLTIDSLKQELKDASINHTPSIVSDMQSGIK